MDWYYSKSGQQLGPIDEKSLRAKITAGELADEDLVWQEGMTDWIPFRELPNPMEETPPQNAELASAPPATPFEPTPPETHPAEAKATTPLILGIISIVGLCVPFVGFFLSLITGIIAIVQGRKIKKLLPESSPARGRANLGWILGLIGVIFCALSLVAMLVYAVLAANNPELREILEELMRGESLEFPDQPTETQ